MYRSESSPAAKCIALVDLPSRQKARIEGFELPPDQRARLMEMGLTPGAEVQLIRYAPLGDPIEIEVRGYRLSLRKREAEGIRVASL